jgi:hypothetical protein
MQAEPPAAQSNLPRAPHHRTIARPPARPPASPPTCSSAKGKPMAPVMYLARPGLEAAMPVQLGPTAQAGRGGRAKGAGQAA